MPKPKTTFKKKCHVGHPTAEETVRKRVLKVLETKCIEEQDVKAGEAYLRAVDVNDEVGVSITPDEYWNIREEAKRRVGELREQNRVGSVRDVSGILPLEVLSHQGQCPDGDSPLAALAVSPEPSTDIRAT